MKTNGRVVCLYEPFVKARLASGLCQVDLAIEKVFPKTIRTKFPWAMHFPSSYVFQ